MKLQTGIFSDLIAENRQGTETRTSLENPQTPLSYPAEWLLDTWNGGRTDSGIRVSELTAFQTTTFLACVDLIAGAIAALPTHIYERTVTNGRVIQNVAYDHGLYDLVHYEPNADMNAFTFKKTLALHFLPWGNGLAELQRDAGNKIIAMWPRNPSKTRPHILEQDATLPTVPWRPFPISLKAGQLVFKTTDGTDGSDRVIASDDMLHIPGLSFDGRIGQSIVWLARQTIGTALATEKFGAKYFANFARPSGILMLPGKTTKEQEEQARRSWMEAQGGENAHRVAVMPPGFDFKPLSNNPQESQSVETQQFIRNQICSVFHVPPHMVGDVDKGRANTEQLAQEFVSYTLGPWLAVLRQEFKRKLFPNPDFAGVGRRPQKNNFFVDFDLHDLLRPDAASREKYAQTMFSVGALSPNDIRMLEGLNPINSPGADRHYVPVNMQDADNPVVVPQQAPDQQDTPGPDPETNSIIPIYSRLFRDALGRILSRDRADAKVFHRTFSPVLYAIADLLCQHEDRDFRPGRPIPADVIRFSDEFIGGMFKRSAHWTPEQADETSTVELERAIGAVKQAVSRAVITKKAKAAEV